MSSKPMRAFTLVELLVVVSVITILLLMMMPLLNSAKSSARRVVCTSNLRQLATGHILYTTNYKNRLPVASTSNTQQFNYAILSGGFFSGMALIADDGDIPAHVFYCPSVVYQPNQIYWYDSSSNPAPTSFHPMQTNYVGNFRAGYSLFWGVTGSTMPVWGKTVTSYSTTGAASNPSTYPAYNGRLPIMSDLAGMRASMSPQHNNGTNVVFGDGHVQWVYFSQVQVQYDALPYNTYNRSNNPQMEAYYIAIGKQ